MVSKGKPSPDQLPLFTPDSTWKPPTELPDLSQETEVAVDIETRDPSLARNTGPGFFQYERTNPNTGYICGISVAWRDNAIYIPLRHHETNCFEFGQVRNWLNHLAHQNNTRFIFHNFQYDWGWIEAVFGIKPPWLLDDTLAMATMVDENQFTFTLDALCEWKKIQGKDERLFNEAVAAYGGKGKSDLWRMPGRYVGPYAEQDAKSTLQLAQELHKMITAEKLGKAYQIERDLMRTTLEMKQKGIRVNVNKAERLAKAMIADADLRIHQLGKECKQTLTIKELRSSKWLIDQFEKRGIYHPYKTALGHQSFEKGVMVNHEHEFPRLVNKLKHQYDLAERFLKGFICEYAHNNRVYPTVNQFKSERGGTKSHRFSYADPPLQQMPSRDSEWAAPIRACFEPEDGETWCSIDYRQQEYRLIVYVAEMLGAKGAKEAADLYRKDPNTDFHEYVSKLTRLDRKRAKDVNFATSYGAGEKKFAAMTGMDPEEARATLEQYNNRLPFVKEAYEAYAREASWTGHITLIDGARAHFNLYEPRDWRDFNLTKWREEGNEERYKRWHSRHPGEVMRTESCPLDEAEKRIKDPDHPWYDHRWERLRRAHTHKAFNRMIQGSAARQTKKAMLDVESIVKPLLQIHDELCFSLADPSKAKQLAEAMENAVPSITIPMLTDIKLGNNWGELEK